MTSARYFIVAEQVPNQYSGWHGLAFLWNRNEKCWIATADVQWSSVSRTAFNATHDTLTNVSDVTIGKSIRDALHYAMVVAPTLPSAKNKKVVKK